jgi:asparagine synthase (glutamine-hydrolysing)
MSGLAAVIARDGHDPSTALASLVDAGQHRAPDGVTTWRANGAALARLHRLVFKGQSIDAQPAVSADGMQALVFDGRLDDRDALAARLSPRPAPDDDDARYALLAVEDRADRAVEILDGDFAFVAWNARTRTVVAARDRIGMRPLYWTERGPLLIVASDLRQMIAALPETPPPDLTVIADLLAFEPTVDARTVYAGVQRLPPGHVLVADDRGVRTRCYWRAEPAPPGAARSDDDYAEECRALLDRAVGSRLRASAPAALFLSGGVDSSSVLSSAVRVARRDGGHLPRPVSLVFDAPESREGEFRRALLDQCGIPGEEVAAAEPEGDGYRAQAARRRMPGDLPGQFMGRTMRRRAADLGARVVLTGEGGDLVFSGTTFVYADLLRAGRVLTAIRTHRLDATYDDSGYTPLGLLTDGVWPLLPRTLRRLLRVPLRRAMGNPAASPWVRLPIAPRDAAPEPPRGVSMASWSIARELNRGWTSYFVEAFERDAVEFGLEPRHPLLDPSLVRFALSLPEDQRRRGPMTKFILRRAAGLPPAIDRRLTKADLGFSLLRALDSLGGRRFFEEMRLAAAGWVDAAEAARGYDGVCRATFPAEPQTGAMLARLWMLASIEVWFRAEYGGNG